MTSAVELTFVSKTFGSYVAVDNVSMQIRDGEFFSMLGPSGCGKTTTLRMIAGFEMPTKGEISIMGIPQGDSPAFKRPVNTVFQNYALFPHMTALQNVAFGLEMQKVARAEVAKRATEALALVRMSDFANRRPVQLSGGQQQRIALARALVNKPQVLLLDEPLGALDLKLRKQMQLELKQMQQEVGITFIYVTHDQEEALTMSDRIAVMNGGKVVQCAPPREIYERPSSRYVADFIGETNFIEGILAAEDGERATVLVDNMLNIYATPSDARLGSRASIGQKVSVALRPEKVGLMSAQQESKDTAQIEAEARQDGGEIFANGVIREMVYIGTDTRYVVELTPQTQVVIRIQNFGNRFDQIMFKGEPVLVYWALPNARVLVD
jgi:spermidine/putrescine transport system ATP-binding protein